MRSIIPYNNNMKRKGNNLFFIQTKTKVIIMTMTELPISKEYLDEIENEMRRPHGTHAHIHTLEYFNEETGENDGMKDYEDIVNALRKRFSFTDKQLHDLWNYDMIQQDEAGAFFNFYYPDSKDSDRVVRILLSKIRKSL